jgi:hypothetical protein
MPTDEIIPRYVYHNPLKVQLPDNRKWQNGFSPANKKGLVWHTGGSNTNEGTGARVYRLSSKKANSFSLVLHTMVFQTEIYAIKACKIENTENSYRGRTIYILSNSQVAIKTFNNFQINSKLFWDCHQSLVKLAEHNRFQLA